MAVKASAVADGALLLNGIYVLRFTRVPFAFPNVLQLNSADALGI